MATTGVPNVLYEASDAPDLVSGAFAQHTHDVSIDTNTNLSNVIPTSVGCSVYVFFSGGLPEPADTFSMDIVSHDLHVLKTEYLPMEGDTESSVITAGISGTMDVSCTKKDALIEKFCVQVSTETFPTGATMSDNTAVFAVNSSDVDIYCGNCLINSASSIDSLVFTLSSTGEVSQPRPSDIMRLIFIC